MNNPTKYAELLLKNHSKEEAKRIARENLAIVSRGPATTIHFDEADFYVSTEGTLARFEMNKTQSKKVEGLKTKREKKNLSFWQQVNALVSK